MVVKKEQLLEAGNYPLKTLLEKLQYVFAGDTNNNQINKMNTEYGYNYSNIAKRTKNKRDTKFYNDLLNKTVLIANKKKSKINNSNPTFYRNG